MKLSCLSAEIFIPDARPVGEALRRVTHLGIGAHQDDLEFMAFHGILAGFGSADKWFGGVTCTDGAGSARAGGFRHCTDAEMVAIRRREQNAAAEIGGYGVMIQLGHPSRSVKDPREGSLREDLKQILSATRPEIVYTHNPADKHETHIGVVVAVLQALRELPREERPAKVWGCEVWRDLDWLPDEMKVLMDVSGHEDLAAALTGVFRSQISGGKRYDRATIGRRSANATFFQSHATDQTTQLIFGMDLTPVIADESRNLSDHVGALIDAFQADVRRKLRRRLGI